MKKYTWIVLVLLLTSILLISCSPKARVEEDKKLSLVTSIFPIYDWTREIIGDGAQNIELSLLIDKGIDLHSYQPSVDDLAMIGDCDLFIYVGGESDGWAKDAISNRSKSINLLEELGDQAKKEEIVEGMEDGHEDHDNHHDHKHEEEFDEHIWLSLKNAKILVRSIGERLGQLDPENKDLYVANSLAYIGKLDELNKSYEEVVDNSVNKTVLFGDRFPFRYLVDDYKLKYYGAFAGCSAETEASFETLAFLSNKLDELGLKNILTIEGRKHKIAETIVANSKDKNQDILVLDSMQSITREEIENGSNYISIMESNLEVLRKALE